ncbi:MAG: hypothetical protein ABR499_02345 [Gemmatimonadaceae bacterium]
MTMRNVTSRATSGRAGRRSKPTRPAPDAPAASDTSAALPEQLVVSAAQQITLRCGESSITLTAAGKIIIRGKYIVSRSSGVQRIKGGSVQIN